MDRHASTSPATSTEIDEKHASKDGDENRHGNSGVATEGVVAKDGTATIDSAETEKAAVGDGVAAVGKGEAAEPEYEYIQGVKLLLVMLSVTLVAFLMLLDVSIIVTAIPQITTVFHSLPDVGWYGSAYLLTNCALQPLTGKIYSNFSSKYTFLTFLLIFEFGSVLCGTARSSNMFIIGRAVAGLGGSGLVNGALTILGASLPMQKRPAMTGIMMGFGQLGIVGGPLIGGALTEYASWRWCFYINLPIGAIAAVFLLLINIPDLIDRNSTEKPSIRTTLGELDLLGFCLFAPFAIMMLLALEWGGTKYAWNSAIVIGLFCGSGATLLIFAAWEYRVGDSAMFPFSMVRQRVVWSACLSNAFFFGAMLTLSYYLPIYFQTVKGVSPLLSGVYILPQLLSQLVMAITSGILIGKIGYYLPFSIACGIMTTIAGGLFTTLAPTTPTAKWVGYQLLHGFGRGCGMQVPIIAAQNVLQPKKLPVGMSVLVFSQSFGGTIFLAVAQTIFGHNLISGLHKYAPTVNVASVVEAGARAVRDVVSPGQLEGVLQAYDFGLTRAFFLSTAGSIGLFVFGWGMGFRNIKKKKEPVVPEA